MIKIVRAMSVAAAYCAAALAAGPATAATTQAAVTASVRKPLELTRVADMNFGSILLSGSGIFTANVVIGQDGSFSCPAVLTCTGATSPATYNASGNKQSPVQINVPSSMTLTGPSGTITLTANAPSTLILTNSGYPGTNFNIGGTLMITDQTKDGVYSGTFSVTADYQ